jgi:hypothetical protein
VHNCKEAQIIFSHSFRAFPGPQQAVPAPFDSVNKNAEKVNAIAYCRFSVTSLGNSNADNLVSIMTYSITIKNATVCGLLMLNVNYAEKDLIF